MKRAGGARSRLCDEVSGPEFSREAEVKLFFSKRRVLAIAAAAVLLLFLVRPGASRLKTRIIYSISAAVGRPVDIGSVHVRFLPRPGFDLENLVVYDDPSFGGEPILRCSEVTALLRLTSLARGRMEIARLDLTEPSLNLVHGSNGRWNLEDLLERSAHMPLAPTSKAKSEPRPGFPYIEATSARVNFKHGPEKKPYALTNADFSLWQESENSWGVRLKAQPFRSDLNLNDVGMVQVEGTWQRAANLQTTPLQLTANWSHAQLGQVTKFFSGNDKGWRGTAEVNVTLSGTPLDLQIANSLVVQDFRRYDITTGSSLRLALRCTGKYTSSQHMFDDVDCQAPVGKGLIALQGSIGLPATHTYDVTVSANDIPASSALALVERAKKNLPEDLAAEGKIQGNFSMSSEGIGATPSFEGNGEISALQLTSPENKGQLGPEPIPFVLTNAEPPTASSKRRAIQQLAPPPAGPRFEFGPVGLGPGHAAAPTVRGWVNLSGYGMSVSGEGDIARMLRLARMGGIPALQTTAEGTAQVDLLIAGSWINSGSVPPVASGPEVTGLARLRNVRVSFHGAAPTEIASADLQLAPDGVHVRKLNALAAEAVWFGSADLPRGCSTPAACKVQFDLRTSQLSFHSLVDWASPNAKSRPWYRVLEASPDSFSTWLGALRASGHIAADHLQIAKISASHVAADITLQDGKLTVSPLAVDLLQGKHTGRWEADFATKTGKCSGSGKFIAVSLGQLAQSMNDRWISGSATASYELNGPCTGEFWSAAEGSLKFDIRDGVLPHVQLTEGGDPFKLTHFLGEAKLHDGRLELKEANVDSVGTKYEVSGTASLQQELNLKLAHATGGYTIGGTLAEPQVAPMAGAVQARLKPTEPAK